MISVSLQDRLLSCSYYTICRNFRSIFFRDASQYFWIFSMGSLTTYVLINITAFLSIHRTTAWRFWKCSSLLLHFLFSTNNFFSFSKTMIFLLIQERKYHNFQGKFRRDLVKRRNYHNSSRLATNTLAQRKNNLCSKTKSWLFFGESVTSTSIFAPNKWCQRHQLACSF